MHRRWLLIALVSLMIGWSGGSATAQTSIPNGVFVHDADHNLYLVLDGWRSRVPIYPASPEDVTALPVSSQWIMPTEGKVVTSGSYPYEELRPGAVPNPGLFSPRP